MPGYMMISADSHVSEPPNLWVERVDSKFKDRAPRLATDLPGKQGAYFLYEGLDPHPLGVGLAAGKTPEELAQFLQAGTYADARPGGWDQRHAWRTWRLTAWKPRFSTPRWAFVSSG